MLTETEKKVLKNYSASKFQWYNIPTDCMYHGDGPIIYAQEIEFKLQQNNLFFESYTGSDYRLVEEINHRKNIPQMKDLMAFADVPIINDMDAYMQNVVDKHKDEYYNYLYNHFE